MFINFSKTPPKKAFSVQTSEGVNKNICQCKFSHIIGKTVKSR